MSAIAIDLPGEAAGQGQPHDFSKAVHRMYRKGATANLSRVLGKLLPSDIAQILTGLHDMEEVKGIFELIPVPRQAGLTLKEVSEEHRDHLFAVCSLEVMVPIMESLPSNIRSQMIGSLHPKVAKPLMEALHEESQQEVENLLKYLPGTAGNLMTSQFFSLSENTSAGMACEAVRGLARHETIFYVYTLDDQNRLTGVASLRHLLLARPDKPLKEIVNTRLVTVNVNTPQDQAAKEIARYRLLAIPVVNDYGVMRGTISLDDLVHVVQEAANRAMMRVAGLHADDRFNIMSQSFLRVAKNRIPWLVIPFLGGLVAAATLSLYEETLATVVQLSFFMPLIFGMAGNVGSQAATVAVRGLATGAIQVSHYIKLLTKEVSVGILIGSFYGLCLAVYAMAVFQSSILAFTVAISIISNITYAGIIASSLPIIFQKLGFDPALGGGPFVLTAIDVLGVVNYLILATLIYGL